MSENILISESSAKVYKLLNVELIQSLDVPVTESGYEMIIQSLAGNGN